MPVSTASKAWLWGGSPRNSYVAYRRGDVLTTTPGWQAEVMFPEPGVQGAHQMVAIPMCAGKPGVHLPTVSLVLSLT